MCRYKARLITIPTNGWELTRNENLRRFVSGAESNTDALTVLFKRLGQFDGLRMNAWIDQPNPALWRHTQAVLKITGAGNAEGSKPIGAPDDKHRSRLVEFVAMFLQNS